MRFHLHFFIFFAAILLFAACSSHDYVNITGYAQGGTYLVKINRSGVKVPNEEIKMEIDRILEEIDSSLSGYNSESLLSRYNRGETLVANELFSDIFSVSRNIWEETSGVVDVASAPLFDLWGFGFTSGEMPSDEELSETLKLCGMAHMPDSIVAGSTICSEGRKLNYNAIAQGYSCDLIARYLYSIGVGDMLINVGGEIFVDGKNPSGKSWKLGIDRPEDGNNVAGAMIQAKFSVPRVPCGVVTSGNYRKFYVRDGKKYAHTIDPRSGYPVQHSLLSATVVADDATVADAYATYCMVVGLEEARNFILSRPDLDACLLYDEDGTIKSWTSPGLHLE